MTERPKHERVERRITAAQAKAQGVGATPIAPGIWRDVAGHVHFSLPDILAHVGLENTPENSALAERLIGTCMEAVVAATGGETTLIRQHVVDPTAN